MCVLFFVPLTIDGMVYSMADSPLTDSKGGKAKRRHMTYIFTVFVFLQLFN